MTKERRAALEARVIAARKSADPEPFTRVVRGRQDQHAPALPPPVYASPADGPGAVPRRVR